MTLEQRAKAIADCEGRLDLFPSERRLLEATALRMLREAVDEALSKSAQPQIVHNDWVGR